MKKKWTTTCNGKKVKHGASGYRIGKVGSAKQKSYCARSLGITKKFPSALFERTVEVTDLKQEAINNGLEISESAMKYPAVEVVGFWDGVLWIEDKNGGLQ